MSVAISLREFVGELDMVSDEMSVFLNRRTGEFAGFSHEQLAAAESEEDATGYPEWQRELIQQAGEVLESDDYITLPSNWDIHDYEVMRNFCLSVEDEETREDLLDAIRGSGAFSRFRIMIQRRNLEEAWYRFRDQALADIAVEWLEDNGLVYVRDLDTGDRPGI